MRAGYFVAFISMLAGATAAAIGMTWLVLTGQNAMQPLLPQDLADIEGLMAVRALYVALEFVLPAAATVSILTGVAGWRQPAAKIGVVCSLVALAILALALTVSVNLF